MVAYHDDEWGVPTHDDAALFELLTLEGAQAGLSWRTILNKRVGYRAAFGEFDPATVARYTARDVDRLLGDAGIVRHRGKIESTVDNAQRVLEVQDEHGSFDAYVWSFVDGAPIVGTWQRLAELPSSTPASTALSRDLKRRGFRFVGPTTVSAFMQAAGLVDDHVVTCFRHSNA
jgi:DNA-3-methyladenine glycosylase I